MCPVLHFGKTSFLFRPSRWIGKQLRVFELHCILCVWYFSSHCWQFFSRVIVSIILFKHQCNRDILQGKLCTYLHSYRCMGVVTLPRTTTLGCSWLVIVCSLLVFVHSKFISSFLRSFITRGPTQQIDRRTSWRNVSAWHVCIVYWLAKYLLTFN